MEGEEQEEHLNEADPPEPAGDDSEISSGTPAPGSLSFQCIFCNRGFLTAQARGGHMNLHRKERATIRPARSSPAYHPYSRENRPTQPHAVESSSTNLGIDFPGSSLTSDGGDKKELELELAGEKPQLDLGGPGQDIGEEKDHAGSEDLDLDLRLGYSKGHESSSDRVQ